jgi:protein tyrosine phosphatase (PTP) superfamily phosphohydrolase (DUF442 family)
MATSPPVMPTTSLSQIRSFRQISDRLGTAGQPTEEELSLVRDHGYEVVINLALPTSTNALANEGSIVSQLGLTYVHIPVNFENPAAQDFEAFCRVMKAFEARRLFVHCAMNMRVSAFVFLHRVLQQGVAVDEAQRDLHAIWQPDDVWSRFIRERLERVTAQH